MRLRVEAALEGNFSIAWVRSSRIKSITLLRGGYVLQKVLLNQGGSALAKHTEHPPYCRTRLKYANALKKYASPTYGAISDSETLISLYLFNMILMLLIRE